MRNYLYVSDAAAAFVLLLRRGVRGQVYNISGQQECSTLDIARAIQRLFPDRPPELQHVRDRDFNDQRYSVDASKLRALGWAPRITLEHGLPRCQAWYAREDRRRYRDLALSAHPTHHPDT